VVSWREAGWWRRASGIEFTGKCECQDSCNL
jgi:hypothetical protein